MPGSAVADRWRCASSPRSPGRFVAAAGPGSRLLERPGRLLADRLLPRRAHASVDQLPAGVRTERPAELVHESVDLGVLRAVLVFLDVHSERRALELRLGRVPERDKVPLLALGRVPAPAV